MTPVYAHFAAAVAEHIGQDQAKAIASRQRFCGKRRHWCAAEGGTGAGRKWRCAACSAARLAAHTRISQEAA